MNILAIDLGTQSVRAAVVSIQGEIKGIEQIKQEVDVPYPGWAQQDPNKWWEMAASMIRTVLKKTDTPPEAIAAICSCGQMIGPTGIDDTGTVTTGRTQLWCDKRCEDQCEVFRKRFGETMLSRITANPPTVGAGGLKVRWLLENQKDRYDKTRFFLSPKDFINYKLTGVAATDFSEASATFLWDASIDAYSEEMADMLGLDLSKFPPVAKSYEIIGKVTAAAAREAGLVPGIPVMAGGGDFLVSLICLGLTGAGDAVEMSGTSTLFVVHRDKPIVHPFVQNLRHVLGGWVPFFMLDCGGLSMKWCHDLIASARDADTPYEELIAMAEEIPAGAEGLIFYPYMLGERRRENVHSMGGFLGITLNHSAAHFIRAVMEGVALAIGMNVEVFTEIGVKIETICCVGGATRNHLWNQIKADVLQTPIKLTDEPEATLIGAGLLGALGVGLIDDIGMVAKKRQTTMRRLLPNPENKKIYQNMLSEFKRVYEHMLGFWQECE
ncbi:MAG: hypothetical protein JEZ11_08670 [Desulfobacterales bacterium]|nr:hypothetical protein [Desulfobacterales bacterium]